MNEIDRYAILGELGRGPRGVVYKARDQLTDRVVALKTIDPLPEGREASRLETAWFINDALSAWRLTHPNIVTVYAAGDVWRQDLRRHGAAQGTQPEKGARRGPTAGDAA